MDSETPQLRPNLSPTTIHRRLALLLLVFTMCSFFFVVLLFFLPCHKNKTTQLSTSAENWMKHNWLKLTFLCLSLRLSWCFSWHRKPTAILPSKRSRCGLTSHWHAKMRTEHKPPVSPEFLLSNPLHYHHNETYGWTRFFMHRSRSLTKQWRELLEATSHMHAEDG